MPARRVLLVVLVASIALLALGASLHLAGTAQALRGGQGLPAQTADTAPAAPAQETLNGRVYEGTTGFVPPKGLPECLAPTPVTIR